MENYQAKGFDQVLMKPLDMQALSVWLGCAKEPDTTDSDCCVTDWQIGVVNTESDIERQIEIGASTKMEQDSVAKSKAKLEPLLDDGQLTQDMGYLGKEAVLELFSLYQDSSQAHMATLAKAPEDFERVLHALKGSSASMGLTSLAAKCRDIEQLKISAAAYQLDQHPALFELWQRSLDELSKWLDGQKNVEQT